MKNYKKKKMNKKENCTIIHIYIRITKNKNKKKRKFLYLNKNLKNKK